MSEIDLSKPRMVVVRFTKNEVEQDTYFKVDNLEFAQTFATGLATAYNTVVMWFFNGEKYYTEPIGFKTEGIRWSGVKSATETSKGQPKASYFNNGTNPRPARSGGEKILRPGDVAWLDEDKTEPSFDWTRYAGDFQKPNGPYVFVKPSVELNGRTQVTYVEFGEGSDSHEESFFVKQDELVHRVGKLLWEKDVKVLYVEANLGGVLWKQLLQPICNNASVKLILVHKKSK